MLQTGNEIIYNNLVDSVNWSKITNGSCIHIGKDRGCMTIYIDKHFNWFQKKMIKWCFGFDVVDFKEE